MYDLTAGPVPLCKITALLMLPEADAMAKVERVIGAVNSVDEQFEAALAICYNNDCYKGQRGDHHAYRELFHAAKERKVECWLELALGNLGITHDELTKFKADINKESAIGTPERDINAKYIMTVLKRVLPRGNQQFREERVRVECVAIRNFDRNDLVLITKWRSRNRTATRDHSERR